MDQVPETACRFTVISRPAVCPGLCIGLLASLSLQAHFRGRTGLLRAGGHIWATCKGWDGHWSRARSRGQEQLSSGRDTGAGAGTANVRHGARPRCRDKSGRVWRQGAGAGRARLLEGERLKQGSRHRADSAGMSRCAQAHEHWEWRLEGMQSWGREATEDTELSNGLAQLWSLVMPLPLQVTYSLGVLGFGFFCYMLGASKWLPLPPLVSAERCAHLRAPSAWFPAACWCFLLSFYPQTISSLLWK